MKKLILNSIKTGDFVKIQDTDVFGVITEIERSEFEKGNIKLLCYSPLNLPFSSYNFSASKFRIIKNMTYFDLENLELVKPNLSEELRFIIHKAGFLKQQRY